MSKAVKFGNISRRTHRGTQYGLKAIKITVRKETEGCCENLARDEVRKEPAFITYHMPDTLQALTYLLLLITLKGR